MGHLVLTRHTGESVCIGDDVEVEVREIRDRSGGPRVRLLIKAPPSVRVDRKEIREKIERERDKTGIGLKDGY